MINSPKQTDNLQAAAIAQFTTRFASGAVLAYARGTFQKENDAQNQLLAKFGCADAKQQRLFDAVLYDPTKDWLILLAVVGSRGPMTPTRTMDLRQRFVHCGASITFVSVFPDRESWAEYVDQIAWETEVWIANEPDHLIHYNGDRFLGPAQ
jgi:hypothetical protein